MTTATNIPMNLDAVRAFLAAKERRRQKELDRRFAVATSDFARIVAHIVATCAPRRILQWGSLLDRRRFSEISDIDIALEGVSGPQAFFAILGAAIEMTDFPVDIVEMEKIGRENAAHIREVGRVVYERP